MKKYFLMIVFIVMAGTSPTFSNEQGGGVIVGNGAGIVENNFQFAYQSLETILSNCMDENNCRFEEDEIAIINSILKIVKMNAAKKDRLVFVSEKMNPGFFTTSDSETNRIAKTALDPNAPIYINADQLYNENGSPALDFVHIIAILVHELGHQSGILYHSALDILGTKVGGFAEIHTDKYTFKIDDETESSKEGKSITFSISNFDYPIKRAILFFYWGNTKLTNLSNTLYESLNCRYDSESFAGVEVTNGHYGFDSNNNLVFKAWAKVHCFESFSNLTFVYRKDLSILFDNEYKVLSLIVE